MAALVASALFATRNQVPVEVDYVLGRSPERPLWLILAVAVCCGALATSLVGAAAVFRARIRERRQRRRADRLAGELHRLRNLPIQGESGEAVATISTAGSTAGDGEAAAAGDALVGSVRRP